MRQSDDATPLPAGGLTAEVHQVPAGLEMTWVVFFCDPIVRVYRINHDQLYTRDPGEHNHKHLAITMGSDSIWELMLPVHY